MILADKIIKLRKKKGWSQEEFAEKLDVSRQSVSKWETAQSSPDLTKIVLMSEIFDVSTDFLLKDSIDFDEKPIENLQQINQNNESSVDKSQDFTEKETQKSHTNSRKVSHGDACEYLDIKKRCATLSGLATFLCIFSIVVLFFFVGFLGDVTSISDTLSVFLGFITMLCMLVAACIMYVYCGTKSSIFSYIGKVSLLIDDNTYNELQEKYHVFSQKYIRFIIIAISLCTLSFAPLIFLILAPDYYTFIALGLFFTMIAFGVYLFIYAGIMNGSFKKILQLDDYSPEKLEANKKTQSISTIYWLVTTALYLAYSFISQNWGYSWIIWPVAGVLFGAFIIIYKTISDKKA